MLASVSNKRQSTKNMMVHVRTMEITITPAELVTEQMTTDHLEQAVKAIREDGYVILADVINQEHLDILRERMTEDSHKLIAAEKWGGAGAIKGHLQQGPPPFAPYVFRDIVANPFAIQVTREVLGEGVYNRFYNGNANCPGSNEQPLHADGPHLWPNMSTAHPSATLIINICLRDVTEENGATEIWPGTHQIPMTNTRISEGLQAQRRETSPPVRAQTKKGSLLIRDVRLWHRGVPNHSNDIRHMIALIHNVHWLQRPTTLLFNSNCAEAFPESDFDHNVEFTDKPLEYLYTRFPQIVA